MSSTRAGEEALCAPVWFGSMRRRLRTLVLGGGWRREAGREVVDALAVTGVLGLAATRATGLLVRVVADVLEFDAFHAADEAGVECGEPALSLTRTGLTNVGPVGPKPVIV